MIWQFTNIWNDFLLGASFGGQSQPMTVALNNLVQSSTGVKEYNVHFAGAILAALPTLFVYILAGRFFVRSLMAGSVKGYPTAGRRQPSDGLCSTQGPRVNDMGKHLEGIPT